MPPACNIDDRGRKVRLWWGVLCLLAALGLAAGAWLSATWWLWILAAFAFAGALLAFYEARNKWCIVRAMGIKTPL